MRKQQRTPLLLMASTKREMSAAVKEITTTLWVARLSIVSKFHFSDIVKLMSGSPEIWRIQDIGA